MPIPWGLILSGITTGLGLYGAKGGREPYKPQYLGAAETLNWNEIMKRLKGEGIDLSKFKGYPEWFKGLTQQRDISLGRKDLMNFLNMLFGFEAETTKTGYGEAMMQSTLMQSISDLWENYFKSQDTEVSPEVERYQRMLESGGLRGYGQSPLTPSMPQQSYYPYLR